MGDLSTQMVYIQTDNKQKNIIDIFMIKKALWLDDERQHDNTLEKNFFPDDEVKWYVAKDYTDFCHIIREEVFDLICFDHDLGSDMTGYDCCKYMVDYYDSKGLNLPQVFVQSANPVGKEKIYSYINSYKKNK